MSNSSNSSGYPTTFKKPWLSFEDQVKLLKERGLLFDNEFDDKKVEYLLSAVGYYRLSGYWYIFQNKSICGNSDKSLDANYFEPKTTFRKIWNLYIFDEKLKLTVLRAISHLEIYMRTQLAYYLSEPDPSDESKVMNAFGYEDKANFPKLSSAKHLHFLKKCKKQYQRSQADFIKSYKRKYDWNYYTEQHNSKNTSASSKPQDFHDFPPYWILANIMDYGMVSDLYKGAKRPIRDRFSYSLQLPPNVLLSWLNSLRKIRNICAHHDRLWNRTLSSLRCPVALPDSNKANRKYKRYKSEYKKWNAMSNDTPFTFLSILGFFEWTIFSNNDWHKELRDLINSLEPENMHRMGFPDRWEESPLWSQWLAN